MFGFWPLDFGFWDLDFGIWNLDFGIWLLEFQFWTILVGVRLEVAPRLIVDLRCKICDLALGIWSLEFGIYTSPRRPSTCHFIYSIFCNTAVSLRDAVTFFVA